MGGALVDDFIYGQQNSRGFRAQDDIIYLRRKGRTRLVLDPSEPKCATLC